MHRDESVAYGLKAAEATSVKEIMEFIDEKGKNGWNG